MRTRKGQKKSMREDSEGEDSPVEAKKSKQELMREKGSKIGNSESS